MAKHNKTLHLIASKLGLGEEQKVLGFVNKLFSNRKVLEKLILNTIYKPNSSTKADEFHRLLQTKWTAGSNISDTSKVVICLDLAAILLGADLDTKSAIKYSGLKPSTYTNSRKVVENLLELNCDKLTTAMLCLTLQCTGVQDLADKILEEYQRNAKMTIDLNLPQYVCMAVYHACRLNKVKISKSKVIEKSRLKPTQWTKLDVEWTKFVDEHFVAAKKKRGKAKNNAENVDKDEPMEIDTPKTEEIIQDAIESYVDWKRRMLETAYNELKELEKLGNHKTLTPRKSPRKSVQKFSPYKSPSKANRTPNKSVRLLFPTN